MKKTHFGSGWLGYEAFCGSGRGILETPIVKKQKSKVTCKRCLKKLTTPTLDQGEA